MVRRSPARVSSAPGPERAPVEAVTRGLAILAIVWQALTMFPDPVFWPWRQEQLLDAVLVWSAWVCWLALVVLTVARRWPAQWSMRVQAVDAVLMLVAGLHLLTWSPVRLDDGWLAAASLVNLGVGLVGIALAMRWAVIIVTIAVVYVTAILAVSTSAPVPQGEALQYGLYATALGAAVISSRRGLLHAASRTQRMQDAYEQAAVDAQAAHAVQHRSVQLTRLLHETVLNTLNAIVRGVADTPDARARSAERCAQSLEVLRSLQDVAIASDADASPTRALGPEVSDLVSMGVSVDFEVDAFESVPSAVRNAFTAVAREALINVARHAEARQVHVELSTQAGAWEMRVVDDGVGFDASIPSRRLGIDRVMRGSMESVGGTLAVRSSPGRGTRVTARVPQSNARSSVDDAPANAMSLPVLVSFLALSLVSMLGSLHTYEWPVFAVAALGIAIGISVTIVWDGRRRRLLSWWVVASAAVAAPVIYHLQAAASGVRAGTTWSEWASEFIVAMLFVVGAGGPPWAWLVALFSWLVTQGDPFGELLQPGTAIIIAGALYARSVNNSDAAYRAAHLARIEQRSAERANEESTRLVTRRFVELADSTATDLFAGLADGSLDVLDGRVRARCAAEERYIRSLMRIDPQRSALDAMIMRLIKAAHREGVMLDLDVGEAILIDADQLAQFESSALASFPITEAAEPARVSARVEGGRGVLRLVSQIQPGCQPVQVAGPCLVLWDIESRSAMWEVMQ